MREMKNSGVEWIGEIPVDWDTIKIKQLPDRSIENSFVDGDWIESPDISDEGIRYLTTGNIGDGKYKKQGNGFVTLEVFQNLNCKYAYPGDLVISRLNAPYGRSCILPDDYSEYVLAVDNVILRTNNDKKYICYITQCDGYQKSVEDNAKGTTMKRISRTNLGNVLLPFPPLSEQHRIADFLDEKCAKIDAVIEKQKQVIEKLKEYKLSVITEAVTKGLDPTVPMKDSGVEWIGEIPENWEIKKLKYATTIMRGRFNHRPRNDPDYYDGQYPFVQTGDVARAKKYITDYSQTLNDLGYSVSKEFPSGSIVMTIAANVADVAILNFNACFPDSVVGFVPNNVESMYLYYVLKAMKQQLLRNAIISTQLNLNIEIIKEEFIPVPSKEEQRIILERLDRKNEEIDLTIAKKQAIIEKLIEYKKSLIYEVVTGKREV